MNMNYYYCAKCNGITSRESNAKKIKSICDETMETCFITKITNADELATKLRKVFLKNLFELKSMKPTEIVMLNMAFEQGVKVTFNGLRQLSTNILAKK